MANPDEIDTISSLSFTDFPEDVQLNILSFLTLSDISNFACTSKRFVSLCRDDPKLWFSMCQRKFGSKTQINKWGNGKISYKLLYTTLLVYENLIGFWRRSGAECDSPLIFFEWGPFYLAGSRVKPSRNGSYEVVKLPFLWMGITSKGEIVNYLDPDGKVELTENAMNLDDLGFAVRELLIPVNVNFMGRSHIVVEENGSAFGYSCKVSSSGNVREEEYEDLCGSPGSLPDRLMSEIYQYFANKTSPGGNGSARRQRRRERERLGRRKWESEDYVKIVNSSPTPAKPLQGLWKGFCDDMTLEFFLVSYDDIGGIACRKVAELCKPFSAYAPVFWTSNTIFIKSPLSSEEENIYESRMHIRPLAEADDPCEILPSSDKRAVLSMLCMNSSYDLVIPDLAGDTVNPRQAEGRIWQYEDGTFGFGFLRDDYIIDLRCIAQNGQILETADFCSD
ncbi:F-box protein At3g12350 [Lycium ferocissimum]|uniref:F-box protein At3g12350 n=1 Tax=Lycium ferocissimum TaxID=112874 RepID=UPI0028154D12|nr:F-box protein At3g12350 [Lycium ferocissimum]